MHDMSGGNTYDKRKESNADGPERILEKKKAESMYE